MTIRSHASYFRLGNPPSGSPAETPDGHPILGWDNFFTGTETTPCYSPVIEIEGKTIHASNRLWCSFCSKWVRFSDSVSHYKKHVKSHGARMEQIRQLSNPTGIPFAILAFILKRGEPFTALDFFRKFPGGEWLPTNDHFTRILRILKERLEAALRIECTRAQIVNLAVDGWSDQRGRRYQGITARLVHPDTLTAWTRLLAMKEIKSVHESAAELRLILERVKTKYGIHTKALNLCSDRCSMNEAAFRLHGLDYSSLFDQTLWLPCTCHIINNILSLYVDQIRHRLEPIFRLQQRFRKCGPFLAYLVQQAASITSIPSTSAVRWYSSNELFESLLVLWTHMESFAAREGWIVPQLSDPIHTDVSRLRDLTLVFVAAQKELESNDYAVASRFIPHLLGIRKKLELFRTDEPDALDAVDRYIEHLEQEYGMEWDLFTLMTYLNPSLQWEIGRTCSEARFQRITRILVVLVRRQLGLLPMPALEDPPSDDFFTPRGSALGSRFTAEGQVEHYGHIRTHGVQPLRFWSLGHPELEALSVVATNILSLLATSASVERSFSSARQVCTDYQMAMKQETVSARVMVQVNWLVAQPLLSDVLALGRSGWGRFSREREQRISVQDDPWRLGIPDEEDEVCVQRRITKQ
jgi:hypothetical protein